MVLAITDRDAWWPGDFTDVTVEKGARFMIYDFRFIGSPWKEIQWPCAIGIKPKNRVVL
jgi:hypothetical protein